MPRTEATVESLIAVANHVYKGELRTLRIRRYKTGQNAGKLFVEYSINDNAMFTHDTLERRQRVSSLITKAAKALENGQRIELNVSKTSTIREEYKHSLEIRGGTSA